VFSGATIGVVAKNITPRANKIILEKGARRGAKVRTTWVAPAKNRDEKLVDSILRTATKVLGTRDSGMRWLGTPVRGLDFATPISLLGTKDGVKRVSEILGQMEHGVW
jgi:putative toxin-antitoxin system antitoxin component (TIGR02293 family)